LVNRTQNDFSPSIDRIIPSLGYVRGNVVIVSMRANRIKTDATDAELRRVAKFYTKAVRRVKRKFNNL
jgi:hypothetical protein